MYSIVYCDYETTRKKNNCLSVILIALEYVSNNEIVMYSKIMKLFTRYSKNIWDRRSANFEINSTSYTAGFHVFLLKKIVVYFL